MSQTSEQNTPAKLLYSVQTVSLNTSSDISFWFPPCMQPKSLTLRLPMNFCFEIRNFGLSLLQLSAVFNTWNSLVFAHSISISASLKHNCKPNPVTNTLNTSKNKTKTFVPCGADILE